MKYLIICFFLMSVAHSAEMYKVIVRDSAMKLVEKEVSAEELGLDESTHSFESFRIFKSTNETPVDISTLNEEEKLKVATLAYHLKIARAYFINVMKSDYVKNMEIINIRYEMKNKYSIYKHFSSDDDESNNAVTQKESNNYKSKKLEKWGKEIWFRPAKDIESKIPRGLVASQMKAKGGLENDFYNLANSFVMDADQKLAMGINPLYVDQTHYAYELGLILLMKEIFPEALDLVASNITSTMNLDSAMVPEIIYHEYTHLAESDYVSLISSYAVGEGMANYFAAIISGNTEIAGNLGKFGKNIQSIKLDKLYRYHSQLETTASMAHHPFTYNYLWSIRDRISKTLKVDGLVDSGLLFDQILFEARKNIDLGAEQTIAKSLTDSLLKASAVIIQDKQLARDIRLIIKQSAVNIGM